MKIAIDGMGGDNAPAAIVEGVVHAAKEFDSELIIVGQRKAIEAELKKYPNYPSNITTCHASEIVHMHDSPAVSIRKKKDSSISVAVRLAEEGKVNAIVSAGNTGAVVCATTLQLGVLPGVERPGIAVVFPTLTGVSLLIDVGANIDAKPDHLLQYAIMGTVYSRDILGKASPSVGLLNIGEEESKGTNFVKESYKLLSTSNLNFVGNVEGRGIFNGSTDVVVCDGFIGNVVLKVSEGLADNLSSLLKRQLTKSIWTKLGALLSKPAFVALKKETDYSEYGGAPLLGVNGICIISHGSSSGKAIKNAIRVAKEFVEKKVNQHIMDGVSKHN
ncbi:MAG: phosphate acyltransferase PlsX [Candidatus Omnitrophica bacterium]|nr:phosphate acyltransferase PlsX [Candidatus Omnitrophota bacterium]